MKTIFNSKTVWFNIVTFVVGLVIYLQSVVAFNKYATLLGVILTAGNLILRIYFTSQPILATPPSQG